MCLDYMKIEKQIYYLLKKNTDKTLYGLNNGDCSDKMYKFGKL